MQLGNYGRALVCVLEQIPKNLPQTIQNYYNEWIDEMHRFMWRNILNFYMVILQLHNIVPLFYRFVERMWSTQ